MKFREKPIEVEAVQWDGSGETFDILKKIAGPRVLQWDYNGNYLLIKTLEGKMRGNLGDWIIQGVKGEAYPCKPDIFEATYEAVNEEADEEKVRNHPNKAHVSPEELLKSHQQIMKQRDKELEDASKKEKEYRRKVAFLVFIWNKGIAPPKDDDPWDFTVKNTLDGNWIAHLSFYNPKYQNAHTWRSYTITNGGPYYGFTFTPADKHTEDEDLKQLNDFTEMPAGDISSANQKMRAEKKTRIQYQNIVYKAMNLLDRAQGKEPGNGTIKDTFLEDLGIFLGVKVSEHTRGIPFLPDVTAKYLNKIEDEQTEAAKEVALAIQSKPHQVPKPAGVSWVTEVLEYETGSDRRYYKLSCDHKILLNPSLSIGKEVNCPICTKLNKDA